MSGGIYAPAHPFVPEKFSNSVADTEERCPEHLLLTLAINVVIGTFFQGMVAELWNQPLWPNIRSNESSALLTSGESSLEKLREDLGVAVVSCTSNLLGWSPPP